MLFLEESRRQYNMRSLYGDTPLQCFFLEEPLLCFVVNKIVLYSETAVAIVATGLKFAMSVHTSFRSVCGLIRLIETFL